MISKRVDEMSDGELADVIHHLSDILHERLNAKQRADAGSWLKRQMDNASIEVRSWPTWRQTVVKGSL